MILVRLMGGLGNQMFQYAAARRLATARSSSVKFDLSHLFTTQSDPNDTSRTFQLHHFRINAANACAREIARFNAVPKWVPSRFRSHAHKFLHWQHYYEEEGHRFNPEVLNLKADSYIAGRFQSEMYFADISEIIRADFSFAKEPIEAGRQIISEVRGCNSVALHVRRGDYVSHNRYKETLGPLPIPYYLRSVEAMARKINNDIRFFIFSDDIDWCKANLKFDEDHSFVSFNGLEDPIEEFRIMSSCKHFIISNSTFAWWAAWLGNYSEKIVIAPSVWSKNGEAASPDRIPAKWILL
jgi:hypothetical protein